MEGGNGSVRTDIEKYQKLQNILSHPPKYGMGDLLRRILENRRVGIVVTDSAIDPILKEIPRGYQKKIPIKE
jgi:hypothetical protein